MRQKVYITSALRTAIGNFGGILKDLSAVKLGSEVIKNLVNTNNLNNMLLQLKVFVFLKI